MVDVPHDRNHRGAGAQILRFFLGVDFFFDHRRVDQPGAAFAFFQLEAITVFGAQALRHRFLDGLIDRREDVQFHEVGDQLKRFALQLVGQSPHNNGRLHGQQLARGGRRETVMRGHARLWLARARWEGLLIAAAA